MPKESVFKLFGKRIPINSEIEENQLQQREVEESDESRVRRPENSVQCPRCKSKETKFCYFNNYNVNQPRHFCRGCQRYWTAGGALRNVPVGAGRRRKMQHLPQGEVSACGNDGGHVLIGGNLFDQPGFRQTGSRCSRMVFTFEEP
ncbi:hypothetical protein AMTRI_Chr01g110590 [Amborella trichopoda]|uniref:Dof-type domain-containing protein n=1 Tax=Amborella trichopoda TaxID=13333 RepID=W1PZP4_AMBTC|nr:dof zinc finger protein DOF1.5 [Amborella trichopoda]ERN13888.1 hypothetical protein AMTR_s00021p00057700 [Amborella trichopoda]|eukprot:XP_006852421.1 dof zinc finger protein DOF1.5 [Amborella trichopoda]